MPRRLDASQRFLFPVDPRDLADEIGLNWWAAKKLYDDKWLSFDPEKASIDNPAVQAEFVFLGSLVAAGCDPHILERLLRDLQKPYSYVLSKTYYDWSARCWKDLPDHSSPMEIVREIIDGFEEDGNNDLLIEVREFAQEAIGRLNADDDSDSEEVSEDSYVVDPGEDSIVSSTRQLLWKIAGSPLTDTPAKVLTVGKFFGLFQKLPKVTVGECLSLNLVGPRRQYGDHEIYHFWTIELDEGGYLSISSGGHFYRPETGGDSFTAMTWNVSPGCEPDYSNYLSNLSIVDDADTFENEVAYLDLTSGNYELSVEDQALEDWMEDSEDVDE